MQRNSNGFGLIFIFAWSCLRERYILYTLCIKRMDETVLKQRYINHYVFNNVYLTIIILQINDLI